VAERNPDIDGTADNHHRIDQSGSAERDRRTAAHLDLQINLLTEQKVTKLIRLLEELRADMPGVRTRHDPAGA
jgi:uncharacterized membrane protein